jgi:type VI secretion system protein ImpM
VSAWLFGKLPAHGDFVARGLSPERRARLDAWLSAEMDRARADHGEAFEARYDAAPPWRYAGGGAGAVICPSVDSVGRRFPLVAGVEAGDETRAQAAAAACEAAIFGAFAQGMDADELWHALSGTRLQAGDPPRRAGWWVDGAEAFVAGEHPRGLLSRMLAGAPA